MLGRQCGTVKNAFALDVPPSELSDFKAAQPITQRRASAVPRRANHLWLIRQPYCLSETTTLSTSCPSASLPLKVEVRVFPSLETLEVTVIIAWPPFFIVDTIVSAPTRFTETMSA